jgi:hypothetical protein
MGGCLSRIAGLGLVAALAAGGYHYMRLHRTVFVGNALLSRRAPLIWGGSKPDGAEHFSPVLERLELSELRAAAQRARSSGTPLRVAMYADRALAQVLLAEADRGTVMELYRDGEQYETEERKAEGFTTAPSPRCFAATGISMCASSPRHEAILCTLRLTRTGRFFGKAARTGPQPG